MSDLFYLTDEQRMIRDLARKLARERIAPHAAHYDELETYPEEPIKAIVEAGLYAIWVPETYGGSDMGCLALALVCEEIAAACASTGTQYLDQPLGGLPILPATLRDPEFKGASMTCDLLPDEPSPGGKPAASRPAPARAAAERPTSHPFRSWGRSPTCRLAWQVGDLPHENCFTLPGAGVPRGSPVLPPWRRLVPPRPAAGAAAAP